ncbi:MAG: hypothetical protein DRQ88_03655 [Epsilonproteobacteria bacterium]|nr:MAG: hypothetical protein DRQ89_03835 [Campylobacterota bacterium]RLA67270.1 MAG: hypothetical protein DRQ88_03655 [Campylobacterota bacterium]
MMKKVLILFICFLPSWAPFAMDQVFKDEESNFQLGGDIFSDFNEEVEATRIMKDERFYQYSRFFNFELSMGFTAFDGNRGAAYNNANPSFGLSAHYFMESNLTMGIGMTMSKHSMLIEEATRGYPQEDGVGLIDIQLMRFFYTVRYYIDTTNLGTAITFANPYLVGRVEYWYETNKFKDQPHLENEAGGGIGFSFGFGLEFPIEFKEYYLGIEFLAHSINLPDNQTQKLDPVYINLGGNAYTLMFSFTQTW